MIGIVSIVKMMKYLIKENEMSDEIKQEINHLIMKLAYQENIESGRYDFTIKLLITRLEGQLGIAFEYGKFIPSEFSPKEIY
jgi:hypothetical protein